MGFSKKEMSFIEHGYLILFFLLALKLGCKSIKSVLSLCSHYGRLIVTAIDETESVCSVHHQPGQLHIEGKNGKYFCTGVILAIQPRCYKGGS